MCGILGGFYHKPLPKLDNFDEILNTMEHRGPDSSGTYISYSKQVHFGHRRLAIVDLREHASQPMNNEDKTIFLVFNGEIYNHCELREKLESKGVNFSTCSDTEVVLKAYQYWGKECFAMFNGPFAIALHDVKKNLCMLARDRAGEKPLFIKEMDDGVYFGSELTAVAKLGKMSNQIDPTSLASYLMIGYPLGVNSLLKNCKTLAAGEYYEYNLVSGISCSTLFYNDSSKSSIPVSEPEELLEKLHVLLADSVKKQLNCDVPACILLSGGVDSSLITALASDQVKEVRTFNVTFPEYPNFDESSKAKLIAEHFSTDHNIIEGVDITPDLFISLVEKLDSPINDSSLIPTFLVYQAVSEHCRVALGGDGADELFGGYKHYSRMLNLDSKIQHIAPLLRYIDFSFIKELIPQHYRFRNWFEALGNDLNKGVPNIRAIATKNEILSVLPTNIAESVALDVIEESWEVTSSGFDGIASNCMMSDYSNYLRNSILVKSDRCSMINSVEARAPFLDTRVIDFAFNYVPEQLKVTSSNRKILLKELCKKLLPKSFDLQRKLGFNLPLGEMIRKGEWRNYIGDIMHTENDMISLDYRKKLFEKHLKGKEYTDAIFGIVLLIEWAKANKITL